MTQNPNLDYYIYNAEAYFQRTRHTLPLEALRAFTQQVSPYGRILDAGLGSGRDLRYFSENQFICEGFDGSLPLLQLARTHLQKYNVHTWQADFMFVSLQKGHYQGIWAHEVFNHFPPDPCRRILAHFFQALAPQGALFLTFEEGTGSYEDRTDSTASQPLSVSETESPTRRLYRYTLNDTASLLRQNGFQILSQGRNLNASAQFGYLARRLC